MRKYRSLEAQSRKTKLISIDMDRLAATSVLALVYVLLVLARPAEAASLVYELTDFNFDKHVDGSGPWMLDVYAPCE